MFINYLKLSFRHLWHSKLYSFINVFGLAIGITCVLLAVLYVRDEQSFDDFHKNKSNLYRVTTTLRTEHTQDLHTVGGTGQVQGAAFKAAVPEIQNYVRVMGGDILGDIIANSKTFNLRMLFVDESFFDIFSFPFSSGNSRTALKEINSAVITESTAMKYFGRTDVVGEIIQLPDDPSAQRLGKPMIITAVAKDPPRNSSIQFDIVFPLSFMQLSFEDQNWLNAYLGTFVILQPGADLNRVTEKFDKVYEQYAKEQVAENKKAYGFDPQVSYGLQKMEDIHLNPLLKFTGNRENGIINESKPIYSYLFLGIAVFILLMAAINFINISIAGSLKRAKEVGVRKITGGSKIQIIFQFQTESTLLCIIAFLLALLFGQLILPVFNELSGKQINFNEVLNVGMIGSLLLMFALIVLLTSLYPAYILSGFKPTEVLYQKKSFRSKHLLGRSLVIFQFSLAVFFVIATIIYYRQMNFIKTTDLGYNPNNTIYSWVKGNRKLSEAKQVLKAELAKEPSVKVLAFGGDGQVAEVKVNGKTLRAAHKIADENYLAAAEIAIKAGRSFSTDHPSDKARAVIVNEAFVKAAGLSNPIGSAVRTSDYYDKETKTIIGVVKDFHFESLREPIKPLAIIMSDWASGGIWVKFEKDNQKRALAAFEQAYKKAAPGTMFEYFFVDEYNANEYKQEQRWQKVVGSAAFLCLLICSIGLFGLSHMAATQRLKEIGVRKVLGANVASIAYLLTKDFLKLVLISLVIASPLAGWTMNNWLLNFAYRTEISWWIFLLAGVIAIIIATITVSAQAIKAAIANPVNSLRSE